MGKKSQFSREEKIAAVKLVVDEGRSTLSVGNEYGVHENTIWKWKQEYAINPEGAFTAKEPNAEPANEMERLRRRVRELENEVDFLKKVSAYFVKNPR
ncbi:MAG: transposase [Oscillospiraceae bacterium]|jgi:transposase|nr:transposase [Oscillospiraceae bacterium]